MADDLMTPPSDPETGEESASEEPAKPSRFSRRDFLKVGAAVGGAAVLGGAWAAAVRQMNLRALEPAPWITNPLEGYPSREWEDVYREQYRYDYKVRTCCVPNDNGSCGFDVFIRDGVAVRVEQAYDYQTEEHVTASWNPRGCLKGYNLMRRVYGPYRIPYPLVRKSYLEYWRNRQKLGRKGLERAIRLRGRDEWVRVSWDEAYTIIAAKCLETMKEGAPLPASEHEREAEEESWGMKACVMEDGVPRARWGARRIHGYVAIDAAGPVTRQGSMIRFVNVLGGVNYSEYDWYGDLPPGHAIATGLQTSDHEANDWRNSRYIIHWGKNLIENKMPDAHWMTQIIERGGRMVVVSPDYNPTASKADIWISMRPGTDTALALGMAHVIVYEKLYDADFVKRFTADPLLVRLDTRKYLRASDLGQRHEIKKGTWGQENRWGDFVVWDLHTRSPKVVTREHVGERMGDLDPALEGSFTVRLAEGKEITVKPSFQITKEKLAYYTPERVQEITDAPASIIRQVAREFAATKPAHIHHGEGINHYYHNSMHERAFFLLCSLTGNLGKPGAGASAWAGQYKIQILDGIGKWYKPKGARLGGDTQAVYLIHGPTPTMSSPFYGFPKVWWTVHCNFVNQSKSQNKLLDEVQPKIDLIIVNDWEFTMSCEHADIVLPVHSWWEITHPDIHASPTHAFVQVLRGVIKPMYDAKMDAEIFAGVCKKMSELSGDPHYQSFWTHWYEGQPERYIQEVLDAGTTTKGILLEDLMRGPKLLQFRTYPRIPFWEQVNESKPFYTKTGRVENYKEEERFIELGECTVVHKEPIEATPYGPNLEWEEAKKRRNPLWENGYRWVYLTPHGRHSTHSSWRVADWNLIWSNNFGDCWNQAGLPEREVIPGPPSDRKRVRPVGEPQLEMHPSECKTLGIQEGDYAEVFNDRGRFVVRIKYNERIRPGTCLSYHGWWGRQYKKGTWQSPTGLFINPAQESPEVVHKAALGQALKEGVEFPVYSPSTCPKECLVGIRKVQDGKWTGRGEVDQKDDLWRRFLAGELHGGS
mgnify:CR=1 FL=1